MGEDLDIEDAVAPHALAQEQLTALMVDNARLRAELDTLKPLAASAQKASEQITAMTAELHEQRDEIERLRAALVEISNMGEGYDLAMIKVADSALDALRGESDGTK